MSPRIFASLLLCASLSGGASRGLAQLVVLPAPRLLTVFPMGVQAGTSIEVSIAGYNIDLDPKLVYSTPKLSA